MQNQYDIDYQINKLQNQLSQLSEQDYEFFMSEYPLTVPAPDKCVGTANKDICPRAAVIKAVFTYNPNPCESCPYFCLEHNHKFTIEGEV